MSGRFKSKRNWTAGYKNRAKKWKITLIGNSIRIYWEQKVKRENTKIKNEMEDSC